MNHLKKQIFNDFTILTLNRPEKKNAFHPEMIQEITEFFLNAVHEKDTKAIIFQGEGTSFSSGADLGWMKSMVDYTLEENISDSEKLWDMFDAILHCDIPVIGKIQGPIFGGAIGLVACCDYVFAEEKTTFCFSEVRLGLLPAVISGFILKKCAEGLAAPYMISGEVFNVERARLMGLVHETYKAEMPVEVVVEKFINNGVEAMREMKRLLRASHTETISSGYKALATQSISRMRVSDEAQKRLKKFLEKSNK